MVQGGVITDYKGGVDQRLVNFKEFIDVIGIVLSYEFLLH